MTSTTFGQALEDGYLTETDFPIIKENLVVISGCSGGGKSTLLSELAVRGYSVVFEPGRQLVKEQTAIEGDALPWSNLSKFLDLALSRYLFQFNSQNKQQQLVFFDRGIVDALQFDQSQPEYFRLAARKFRYNRLVFLVPPWEEIFDNDAERKHDFESAKKEFDKLLIKYKDFGYETVLVPKASVKERADFILEKLASSSKRVPKPKFFVTRAMRLLDWNREKLTSNAVLKKEDLKELFAAEFVVKANERKYDANHQNYFEFLNRFRSNIDTIDYQVQEYLSTESTVVMPLTATIKRRAGTEDVFDAIMLVKFDDSGKVVHWQEVYSVRRVQ